MISIAFGFTFPDGREPAEKASTFPPPCIRANASAIWLRQEFSTHTNKTRFIILLMRHHNFRWPARRQPAKQKRRRKRACELSDDECGRVDRPDAGEGVA